MYSLIIVLNDRCVAIEAWLLFLTVKQFVRCIFLDPKNAIPCSLPKLLGKLRHKTDIEHNSTEFSRISSESSQIIPVYLPHSSIQTEA